MGLVWFELEIEKWKEIGKERNPKSNPGNPAAQLAGPTRTPLPLPDTAQFLSPVLGPASTQNQQASAHRRLPAPPLTGTAHMSALFPATLRARVFFL